jgi:ABC-type transport system involved in multi-copper enzyme maturation permease subunit
MTVTGVEWQRSVGPGRVAVWLVLTLFPVAIVSLIRYLEPALSNARAWSLVIGVLTWTVSVLGVLAWATPAVQMELENRTWIYSASRPYGRRCTLLGRYLVAVAWAAAAGSSAIVISVAIARPPDFWQSAAALLACCVITCAAYGALYCLLAAMFPRRAMVIAVTYTFVFELVVAWLPAVINQFTIQFRLRCLFFDWALLGDLGPIQEVRDILFSTSPAWLHLLVLAIYIVALLTLAVAVLERRQLVTSEE